MKKLTALLLALMMLVFALASCAGTATTKPTGSDGTTASGSETEPAFVPTMTPEEAKAIVAVQTEGTSVDLAVATYFFYVTYRNILNNYSQYLSSHGLDPTKSLKTQKYDDGTWFDYFLSTSSVQMKDIILFCDYAKEQGYELSDEDRADIDAFINSVKEYAESSGSTVDEIIAPVYGSCVDEEVLRECLEIQILADKGFAKFESDLTYTQDDYEECYKSSPEKFDKVSLRTYAFTYSLTEEDSADDAEKIKADAKAKAEALAGAESEEQFCEMLKGYIMESGKNEETADEYVKAYIQHGIAESDLTSLGFAEDVEYLPGLSSVVEESGAYAVYYIVSAPSRDEECMSSVRHILFTVGEEGKGTYATMDEARAKADEVLAEYMAGEQTDEAFAALANKYSEDPGSNTQGGLYEGIVSTSAYVDSFLNWTVDPARKVGDTGMVETSYGIHLMYFVERDEVPNWVHEVKQALEQQDYVANMDELAEKYKYSENSENLQKIDA